MYKDRDCYHTGRRRQCPGPGADDSTRVCNHTDTHAYGNTYTDTDAHGNTYAYAHGHADAYTHGDTYAYAHGHADAYTHGNSHSGAYGDTYAYAHGDTHAGAHGDTYAHTDGNTRRLHPRQLPLRRLRQHLDPLRRRHGDQAVAVALPAEQHPLALPRQR